MSNLYILTIFSIINVVSSTNLNCSNNCLFKDCPVNCDSIYWICNQDNYCVHKDFFPFIINDIYLLFIIFIVSIFSTLGGIGGGGLLVPIFILMGEFGLDYSIPITVITIAGNCLTRMIILYNEKHTHSYKRYLIDYSIIFAIVPFDSNMAFIGYIMNVISPNWLILFFLTIVLSYTGIKTFKKGIYTYKKENKKVISTETRVIDGISLVPNNYLIEIDGIEIDINEKEYETVINNFTGDSSIERRKYISIISGLFCIILAFSLTRDLMPKCSIFYWLHYIVQLVMLSILGIKLYNYNINNYKKKKNNNYHYTDGDIIWNFKTSLQFMLISSITGTVSTFVGIGGGMIINPLLIQLGVIPEVSSATNSVTTFFSAIASSIQYSYSGRLLPYYSISCFFTGMIGSFVGLILFKIVIKKLKRNSYIILCLSILIILSLILLNITKLPNIIDNFNNNESISFSNFCSNL